MARALALDVGDRRIGVAISDESKLLARPLEIIDRKLQNPIDHLKTLIAQYAPDVLILGEPIELDGKTGPQAQRVRAFAAELSTVIAIPVQFQDERWSSGEAGDLIKAHKKKRKPQPHTRTRPAVHRHDDALAAAVILQRYLDETRQTTD